jgi:hypothetical protein
MRIKENKFHNITTKLFVWRRDHTHCWEKHQIGVRLPLCSNDERRIGDGTRNLHWHSSAKNQTFSEIFLEGVLGLNFGAEKCSIDICGPNTISPKLSPNRNFMASWLKFGTPFVRSYSGPKRLTRALFLSLTKRRFSLFPAPWAISGPLRTAFKNDKAVL